MEVTWEGGSPFSGPTDDLHLDIPSSMGRTACSPCPLVSLTRTVDALSPASNKKINEYITCSIVYLLYTGTWDHNELQEVAPTTHCWLSMHIAADTHLRWLKGSLPFDRQLQHQVYQQQIPCIFIYHGQGETARVSFAACNFIVAAVQSLCWAFAEGKHSSSIWLLFKAHLILITTLRLFSYWENFKQCTQEIITGVVLIDLFLDTV